LSGLYESNEKRLETPLRNVPGDSKACIPCKENRKTPHRKSGKSVAPELRRSATSSIFIQRIGRLEQKIDEIDLRTRTMMAGLREWMSFKPGYIQKVACQDEVDVEIIERLVQADDGGILPSIIAKDLSRYGLRRWDVTRRIQRMNKRLKKELGKSVAEKRGHRWALSSFMRSAWK